DRPLVRADAERAELVDELRKVAEELFNRRTCRQRSAIAVADRSPLEVSRLGVLIHAFPDCTHCLERGVVNHDTIASAGRELLDEVSELRGAGFFFSCAEDSLNWVFHNIVSFPLEQKEKSH